MSSLQATALSNYLYNKAPNFYGGKQEEYLRLAEETVQEGVKKIQTWDCSKNNLTKLFFDLLSDFRTSRNAIACKHTPDEAYLFGKPRTSPKADGFFMVTGLCEAYEDYNRLFMSALSPIMSKMKHDKKAFSEKKSSVTEVTLGRQIKFEVEILDNKDISEQYGEKPKEAEIQKILNTDKTLSEILQDYQLMKRLKDISPVTYKKIGMTTVLNHLNLAFPSPKIISFEKGLCEGNSDYLKSFYALCTLRIEIGGKLYAMSRYLTWLYTDYATDPVERMVKRSKVFIIHHDPFLMEDTLKEISEIFAKAILWDRKKESLQELKERVALFRYLYSHCTPTLRGDGAIGDWFELAIYRSHGFTKTAFNQKKLPCFETLVSSLSRYLKEYDKIITVH